MSSKRRFRRRSRQRQEPRARDRQGWMTLAEFEKAPKSRGFGYQMCACGRSAQVFAKLVTGRYRGCSQAELEERMQPLLQLCVRMGFPPLPAEPGTPQWQQLEVLENALEFELHPPCGCPTHAAVAAA